MLYIIVCLAADKRSGKAIHVVQNGMLCNRQEKWHGYPCCTKLYALQQTREVAWLSMLYKIVCFAADKRSGMAIQLCSRQGKWQGYPCCTKLYALQLTREVARLSMLYKIVCFATDRRSGKAIHVVCNCMLCSRQEKWQGYPCCTKWYALQQTQEVARLSMLCKIVYFATEKRIVKAIHVVKIVCFAADKRSFMAIHVVQNCMLCSRQETLQGYPCCTKWYALQLTRDVARLSMLCKIVCFAADKRSGKAIHVVQNVMLCNRHEKWQGYPCCTKLYSLQQTREVSGLSMLYKIVYFATDTRSGKAIYVVQNS